MIIDLNLTPSIFLEQYGKTFLKCHLFWGSFKQYLSLQELIHIVMIFICMYVILYANLMS